MQRVYLELALVLNKQMHLNKYISDAEYYYALNTLEEMLDELK